MVTMSEMRYMAFVCKDQSGGHQGLCCEYTSDGISCVLVYKFNRLKHATTENKL
jgi:hypothetical protein